MKTQRIVILSPRVFRPIDNAEHELYNDPHEHKWTLIKRHSKMRESSIDFMLKACAKYQFKKDTFFLAIKIMDMLIKESFEPFFDDFQLIAASLVLLTTKYNEVFPVTIDQINLITEKYYPRQSIQKTEGLILEFLNFEIPQVTVFSELYNELKHTFGKKSSSDSDKQNQGDQNNLPKKSSEKDQKHDQLVLFAKTVKAIKQPECFKYGEEFLLFGLLSYLKNEKCKGSSVSIVKANYIMTIVRKAIDPEKHCDENQNGKPSLPKYLSPRENKLNPENKIQRKQKIFVF